MSAAAATDLRIFALTGLTRKAGSTRRVVISGFDIPARAFMIAMLGLLPGIILAAIVWLFVGEYAIIMLPITEAAIFWLIEARSGHGLHLRTYQTILDNNRAHIGEFFCCGKPVNVIGSQVKLIVASSVAVATSTELPPMYDVLEPVATTHRRSTRSSSRQTDPWIDSPLAQSVLAGISAPAWSEWDGADA